ncbi:Putative Holin-X, holin superfamily III [Aquiflexum balticum DSM 16537]|uniref:Putative Holin-X, holin superfamily III n=1 Tax=Aquiflexum balticum DSM 16537 TaxID=758820 RepID=A0A1W2GZJ8_9BACT|nr:phage holin family protein [Aquiflexum balticum]SMD42069.1 Putative Holin-X, holin superfamily III [Aquiflexum balticum DSM 16537]
MFNVSEIIQTIKQLIEVRISLVKEEINDHLTAIFARIFLLIMMATVSLMALLFASISLAFYLSEKMYSTFKGFLYVSLIYVLVLVLLYFIRESSSITNPTQKFLKKFVLGKRKKDNDEN